MIANIFLNGFYDFRYISFYKEKLDAIDDNTKLLCADGGMKIFEKINKKFDTQIYPDVLLGDMDSVKIDNSANFEIIPKSSKDCTDGEFVVSYAVKKYNCNSIIIFGGLSDAKDYNVDHFLGNLKIMRLGYNLYQEQNNPRSQKNLKYHAVIRDPLQDIHFVVDSIQIERKGNQIERVSLWTDYNNTVVESSKNLRWEMKDYYIDADIPNALRNEFLPTAQSASLNLKKNSDPVFLIHNWKNYYDKRRKFCLNH